MATKQHRGEERGVAKLLPLEEEGVSTRRAFKALTLRESLDVRELADSIEAMLRRTRGLLPHEPILLWRRFGEVGAPCACVEWAAPGVLPYVTSGRYRNQDIELSVGDNCVAAELSTRRALREMVT